MRKYRIDDVIDMHEDAWPVWRICQTTDTPENEVRRMISIYQAESDKMFRENIRTHYEQTARRAVWRVYVNRFHVADDDAAITAATLGITANAVGRILRVKPRRRAPTNDGPARVEERDR